MKRGRRDRAATGGKRRVPRRNNRPITWVTAGDRSPGTEVYAMAANATRAAKTESQSQELRLRGRRIILHSHPPSRCRFCCCRCCLDGGMIGWTGCHHPLPFLHSHLRCHAGSTSLCNEHLPRSGGREITRSFIPYLHSCQLMSHRVQRCAATFSVSFSLFRLPPTFALYRPPFTRADWSMARAVAMNWASLLPYFLVSFSPLHPLRELKFNSQVAAVASGNNRIISEIAWRIE